MSNSIVNSISGRIEKWSIFLLNKHNWDQCIVSKNLFDDTDINPDNWYMLISDHNYQTSPILKINYQNLKIQTKSGSIYYLGEPRNNKYVEILKIFFPDQEL
jgi:hypothetical protein